MSNGFKALLRGGNAARAAVVATGVSLHAVNVFIVATVLPSIVRDIGGLTYFAWSTTLYVLASLLGGASCAGLIARFAPRGAYRLALAFFALGSAICAVAPFMGVLLAGRFVQGLGAGVLSALSFTMVRMLFAEALWPRAFSLVSVVWGVATLGGPALGGVFAQSVGWRVGFWTLAGMAPLLLILVEATLPRDLGGASVPRKPAYLSLVLLAGAVLCVSAGSTSAEPVLNALGLAGAALGLVMFALRERGAGARVMPRGATEPQTRLGATYFVMILLLIGVTTEIFVPYFLQMLQGLQPLQAGYLSALLSGGWSLGSVLSASLAAGSKGVGRVLLWGPLGLALSLLALAVLMPAQLGAAGLVLMGVALTLMGLGIGVCWPHLGAAVFASAPADERTLASASITTVVMLGNALGSASVGMVTNLAGIDAPARAATWVFALFAAAPLLALLLMRKVRN